VSCPPSSHGIAVVAREVLLHAHTQPVLQLVERSEAVQATACSAFMIVSATTCG